MHRSFRRFTAAAFLVAIGLSACAEGSYVTAPPARFRANTRFVGETHDPQDMAVVCKGAVIVGEHGSLIIACFKDGVVHLPNPAVNPLLTGQALGHELGHVNGWPATHPPG